MNHNRQKIVEILSANEATKRINMNIMDAAIRIYDDKNPLPVIYERIARNPVPFLLLLLEIVEIKNRFREQTQIAYKTLYEN